MKNQPQMVRVLVSRETSTEGTLWVAQLLEFDVAAQGVTWKKALMALAQAIADQIVVDTSLGRTPFAGVEPAPADVVNQFDAAMRSTEELPEEPEWARSGSGITLYHMTPAWAAEAAEFNRALGWWLDHPELKYESLQPPPPRPPRDE